jgi:hypothetical protein
VLQIVKYFDTHRSAWEKAGVSLILVGLGDPLWIPHYRDEVKFYGSVYSDPERITFKTLAMSSTKNPFKLMKGVTFKNLGWASKQGQAAKKQGNVFTGDVLQQGACLILDDKGNSLMQHFDRHPADHPHMRIIYQICEIDVNLSVTLEEQEKIDRKRAKQEAKIQRKKEKRMKMSKRRLQRRKDRPVDSGDEQLGVLSESTSDFVSSTSGQASSRVTGSSQLSTHSSSFQTTSSEMTTSEAESGSGSASFSVSMSEMSIMKKKFDFIPVEDLPKLPPKPQEVPTEVPPVIQVDHSSDSEDVSTDSVKTTTPSTTPTLRRRQSPKKSKTSKRRRHGAEGARTKDLSGSRSSSTKGKLRKTSSRKLSITSSSEGRKSSDTPPADKKALEAEEAARREIEAARKEMHAASELSESVPESSGYSVSR